MAAAPAGPRVPEPSPRDPQGQADQEAKISSSDSWAAFHPVFAVKLSCTYRADVNLGDVGVDRLLACGGRDGHPVVPVGHEVQPADPVHLDRRDGLPAPPGQPRARPARLAMTCRRRARRKSFSASARGNPVSPRSIGQPPPAAAGPPWSPGPATPGGSGWIPPSTMSMTSWANRSFSGA